MLKTQIFVFLIVLFTIKLRSMRRFLHNPESGSALVTVIIFILIITLTLTVVLQFNRRQHRQLINKGLKLQCYYNAQSTVYKLIEEQSGLLQKLYSEGKSYQNQLSLFGNDTTFYTIDRWGLLLRIKATSKIKNQKSERSFLVGKKKNNLFSKSLILGNKKSTLILTGETIIEGDVVVGLNGVRAGVLKGKRFRGQNLVLGNIIREPADLMPELHTFNSYVSNDIERENTSAKIHNSVLLLNNQTLVIDDEKIETWKASGITTILGPGKLTSSGNLNFNNITLLNQVDILSDSTVFFNENSSAEQILVKALNIKITDTKELCGQFLANGWIQINNSILKFPSLLAAFNNGITIDNGSVINGTIMLNTSAEPVTDDNKIIISSDCRVNGFVYSNHYTEINGQVYGTLMTDNFHFYLSPTTYINWINGATISRPAFKGTFIIPVGLDTDNEFSIVVEL